MIKVSFIVLIWFPIMLHAQTNSPCNIKAVEIANQNVTKLTENECLGFLKSIDIVCKNNVEYSEFSNGTLFKILETNPLILIKTIEINKTDLHLDLIYAMIEDPIDDGFKLQNIKNKLLEMTYESSIKENIIKCLDKAIMKLF
jgi:TRAP-type uncharacterized transport system substrate-binding protein